VQAYVADASPLDRRTRSLGWLSAVTSLGAVAGPAFGSLMIGVGGQRAPGLAAAALAGLVAAFAWRFLRESREPRTGSTDPGIVRTTGRAAIGRVITQWRDPASRLVWIYAVAIGAFYGTGQTAPLLLADRFGITERNVGYFIMYLGAMGVVVRSLVLGPAVDRLGEARLSRLGIVVLALGLASTGLARGYLLLGIGFTLMPFGTAFLFPCVTGLLSRVVPTGERGLYMGVQHTFGGVSRSAFPIAAGFAMDRFGIGVPFWVAGILVLLTLPLTGEMAGYMTVESGPGNDALAISAADVTGEFPAEPARSLGGRSKEG
jgi:MFS family permease